MDAIKAVTEQGSKLSLGQKVLVILGGLISYLFIKMVKGNANYLRPPGAVGEEEFLAKCARCGACKQACPYQAVKIGGADLGVSLGTPYIDARDIPCYVCPDFHCTKVCPSGALNKLNDINQVNMGIAKIDRKECISWKGLRCEVCYRRCPLMEKAIIIEKSHNPTTGIHAVFAPVVDEEQCVGCGICEHVCILEEPAIMIIPRADRGVTG